MGDETENLLNNYVHINDMNKLIKNFNRLHLYYFLLLLSILFASFIHTYPDVIKSITNNIFIINNIDEFAFIMICIISFLIELKIQDIDSFLYELKNKNNNIIT